MLPTDIKPIYSATKLSSNREMLIGPYLRCEKINLDETEILFRFLKNRSSFKVMIDVGAHTGTTCFPFLLSGWRIIAFEPNHTNSQHLKYKVANSSPEIQKNFTLYEIAISDKSQKMFPFFPQR